MGEKQSNKELREKVYELCDSIGFWNVRPSIVGKQLDTAHSNITRWKQQWINKNGLPQIERYGKELNVNLWTGLHEIVKLAKDSDKKIRLEALRTLFNSQKDYTAFLEAFNYKEKVPEELAVKGEIDLSKAYEEYKRKEEEDEQSTDTGESTTE